MKKVGFVGWRGMVGSVLMNRFKAENDFEHFQTYFFSTSQAGSVAPVVPNGHSEMFNAYDIEKLRSMDIILTCQGGDYTEKIHAELRKTGYQGYWIDAASTLRLKDNAVIILDPINRKFIDSSLNQGIKDFVGGNCTVSLMLLGLHGLFREDLVEWVSSMTYQAASGAGAKNMEELLNQMKTLGDHYFMKKELGPALDAIGLEEAMREVSKSHKFPKENFGHPLALNLLPWIDKEWENGQSKEEWKAQVEANKILNSKTIIPIDGTCVRVGALRSHSQGLTIKLKKSVNLSTVEELIKTANEWVKWVPNNKEATLSELTPFNVSGKLDIAVGRVRPMKMGSDFINAFTVGDQLLWGAAEPLRRMVKFIV